jgi:Flp pilus assembly protein TadG
MSNQCDARHNGGIADRSRLCRNRIRRGQSAVEFAMIAPVALMLMLLGVQYALIGQAALSVSQGASALARYAAINPGAFGTNGNGPVAVSGAAQNLLSSTILTSTKGTSDLTITISSISAATGQATTSTPTLGDQLTINVSYKANNKIALPNPFLGLVTFPTTLASSASQMYE